MSKGTALDVWILVNFLLLVLALGQTVFVIWTGIEDFKSRRWDIIARIIFPILTVVFNIVYWVVYLIA